MVKDEEMRNSPNKGLMIDTSYDRDDNTMMDEFEQVFTDPIITTEEQKTHEENLKNEEDDMDEFAFLKYQSPSKEEPFSSAR